jgi:hypothetical protein
MPFYTIPIKARDQYIAMCREHNAAMAEGRANAAYGIETRSHGYIKAIGDVCGETVAGMILMDADVDAMATYGEVPMCGGMLLNGTDILAAPH